MFTPIGRLLQQAMAHGITNDMIYGGLEPGDLPTGVLVGTVEITPCDYTWHK